MPDSPISPNKPVDTSRVSLYNIISKDYDVGSFNDFSKSLDTSKGAASLYDIISHKYNLGSLGDFKASLGTNPFTPETAPKEKQLTLPDALEQFNEQPPNPTPEEVRQMVQLQQSGKLYDPQAETEKQNEIGEPQMVARPFVEAAQGVKSAAEQAATGAMQVGAGVQNIANPDYANPVSQIGKGLLKTTVGSSKAIFSALGVINPEVAAINEGTKIAEGFAPGAVSYLTEGGDKIKDQIWEKGTAPDWANDAAELVNTLQMAGEAMILHYGVKKAAPIIDKLKSGTQLTPKEQSLITPEILQETHDEQTKVDLKLAPDGLTPLATNPNIEALKSQVNDNRTDHANATEDLNNPDLPQSIKNITQQRVQSLDAEHQGLQDQLGEAQTQLKQDILTHTDLSNQIDELKQSLPLVKDQIPVQAEIDRLQGQADEIGKNIVNPKPPTGEQLATQAVTQDVQSNTEGIQQAEADIANGGQTPTEQSPTTQPLNTEQNAIPQQAEAEIHGSPQEGISQEGSEPERMGTGDQLQNASEQDSEETNPQEVNPQVEGLNRQINDIYNRLNDPKDPSIHSPTLRQMLNDNLNKLVLERHNLLEQDQQLNKQSNGNEENVRSVQEGQNSGQKNGNQGGIKEGSGDGQEGNVDVQEQGEVTEAEKGVGKPVPETAKTEAEIRNEKRLAIMQRANREANSDTQINKKGWSVSNEDLRDYKDIVASYIREGITDTKALIQKLHEDFGDLLAKASDKDIKEQILGEEKSKGEPRTAGNSVKALKEITERLGLDEIPSGEGISPEEAVKRGHLLKDNGASPENALKDFQEIGKIDGDSIALVRAHLADLTKEADRAYDTFGKDSPEFNDAKATVEQWAKDIKPMATEWSKAGSAFQGKEDLDTGSFIAMQRAFKEQTGREPTPKEQAKIEELTKQVKDSEEKYQTLKDDISKKIDEALKKERDKNPKSSTGKSTDAAKKIADNIRKLKSKPFYDADGNPIKLQKNGIDSDAIIEAIAKSVEKGGELADNIAKVLSEYKLSDRDRDALTKQITDAYRDTELEDLQEQFVDKKGNKFSLDEVKSIWDYAKREYLDKGASFDNMLNGVSKELGLSREQVLEAIRSPKTTRKITDEMYLTQSRRTSAINTAKRYIETQNKSPLVKVWQAIPRLFFHAKVFGHGTVGMITHAGGNIFKPTMFKPYWRNFFKQYKLFVSSDARYAEMISHLTNDPDYAMWKRAGLKIDPEKVSDDYQAQKNFFGKFLERGNKGFDALKFFRLDAAKQIYDRLSNAEKADPEVLKEIATQVNHSTGTTNLIPSEISNTAIFAPRLELSRWQRIAVQPFKALSTFSKWDKATPAEKVGAKLTARNSGETIGTYLALLAANQGLLSILGSNQQINFSNPSKSDWLKFKGFDRTFDVSSGMVHSIDFLSKLWQISQEDKAELHGDSRTKAIGKTGLDYVRGKLSPFAGTGVDFALGHDYAGNTMPTSNDEPDHGYNHQLTWTEYVTQHQLPIPISEAFQSAAEGMSDQGLSNATINGVLDGIISGGTGTVTRKEYNENK